MPADSASSASSSNGTFSSEGGITRVEKSTGGISTMSDPIENKHTGGISDELRALTRRVDRLERSNRMLKIVSLVALAAVIVATRIPITSAGPSGVINALQYNLYSRSGTLLATLGTNTSGFPSLTFFDATGKRLTQVGEADNGKGAGVYGFDNNAVLPGKGVTRASFG